LKILTDRVNHLFAEKIANRLMGADSNDNVLLPFLPREKEAGFSGCSLSASFQCPPFQWRGNKNLSQRVLYHTQETGPRIRFGVFGAADGEMCKA
jgi:hypothetical protein